MKKNMEMTILNIEVGNAAKRKVRKAVEFLSDEKQQRRAGLRLAFASFAHTTTSSGGNAEQPLHCNLGTSLRSLQSFRIERAATQAQPS